MGSERSWRRQRKRNVSKEHSAGRGRGARQFAHVRSSVLVLLSGLALARLGLAADAPDAALLEFLGSVDSDDQAWREYLAQAHVPGQGSQGTRSAPLNNTESPAAAPAAGAPAPASGTGRTPAEGTPPVPPASTTPTASRPPSAS